MMKRRDTFLVIGGFLAVVIVLTFLYFSQMREEHPMAAVLDSTSTSSFDDDLNRTDSLDKLVEEEDNKVVEAEIQDRNPVVQSLLAEWNDSIDLTCGDKQLDRPIFYNRVPKCGSGTVLQIFHKGRGCKVVSSPIYGKPSYKRPQKRREMCDEIIDMGIDTCFDRHFYFLEPLDCGVNTDPFAWINIVRHPLTQYVSQYYWYRENDVFRDNGYGDFIDYWNDYKQTLPPDTRCDAQFELPESVDVTQPNMVKKAQYILFRLCTQPLPLGDCINTYGVVNCCVYGTRFLVQYFCGHHEICEVGTHETMALQRAQYNILKHYVFVGLTEDLETTMQMFKILLPRGLGNIQPDLVHSKRAHNTAIKHSNTTRKVSSSNPAEARAQLERELHPDKLKELDEFLSLSMRLYNFVLELFYKKTRACGLVPQV